MTPEGIKLAIEMRDGKGYGVVHRFNCRDLRDKHTLGYATSAQEAEELVANETSWEPPYSYAPCVRFSSS